MRAGTIHVFTLGFIVPIMHLLWKYISVTDRTEHACLSISLDLCAMLCASTCYVRASLSSMPAQCSNGQT